jgi:hypothetical protein
VRVEEAARRLVRLEQRLDVATQVEAAGTRGIERALALGERQRDDAGVSQEILAHRPSTTSGVAATSRTATPDVVGCGDTATGTRHPTSSDQGWAARRNSATRPAGLSLRRSLMIATELAPASSTSRARAIVMPPMATIGSSVRDAA